MRPPLSHQHHAHALMPSCPHASCPQVIMPSIPRIPTSLFACVLAHQPIHHPPTMATPHQTACLQLVPTRVRTRVPPSIQYCNAEYCCTRVGRLQNRKPAKEKKKNVHLPKNPTGIVPAACVLCLLLLAVLVSLVVNNDVILKNKKMKMKNE